MSSGFSSQGVNNMREIMNKAGRTVIKAVVCKTGVVKVFFDYRLYNKVAKEEITKQEIVNRLRGLMAAGLISEFGIERLSDGEIDIFYNPLCHKIDELEPPLNKLILFIDNSAES